MAQREVYILEGSSGTRKPLMLDLLSQKFGFEVVRGIPSQGNNNDQLTRESQEILNDRKIDFKLALKLPPEEGAQLLRDCTKIWQTQLAEAIRISSEGAPVVLRGSLIRLRALADLSIHLAVENGDEARAEAAHQVYEEMKLVTYKGTTGVNGIFHMIHPFHNSQSQTHPWEDVETAFITYEIDDLTKGNGLRIPVARINNFDHFNTQDGFSRLESMVNEFINRPFVR